MVRRRLGRGGVNWTLVAGLLAATGLVIIAASRQRTKTNPAPAIAAPSSAAASVPAPTPGADVVALKHKYVEARSKEILRAILADYGSSEVSGRTMELLRATAHTQAGSEWSVLSKILGVSWDMGRKAGDDALYNRAADLVWADRRDLARLGVFNPSMDELRYELELAADKIRLERRIDAGR